MRTAWKVSTWLAFLSAAAGASSVEIRPELTHYNLQSQNGVPISETVGVPPGSNGLMPTGENESGSLNTPTRGQFSTLFSFGGIPGRALSEWLTVSNSATLNAGTNSFSARVAQEMKLPVATSNNVVVMVLRRAQIGGSFISRQISFSFGSVVHVPDTDVYRQLLTNGVREAYWRAEPYSDNNHEGAGYYWSPYARKVFAIQAGPVAITWMKAEAVTTATVPTDYVNPNGTQSFWTNGESVYLLHTVRYVVSGTAVKPPRRIYWTEKEFGNVCKPIMVPSGSLGIHIVYNNNFPKTVPKEYVGLGNSSPTDGTSNTNMPELRTLWFNASPPSISAYNAEGRVFMELLRQTGSDRHLGFEIVDVYQRPSPVDVENELGEVIAPPPASSENLEPEPVNQLGEDYAYRHDLPGTTRKEFYATRETLHLNDYLVHWMEEGLEGLKWPSVFARYHLVWPRDVSRYSHYVRPLVFTEEEAKLTAIPLPTQNAPIIAYQDPLDRPRAKLTEEFKFFTWLDTAHPAHRALLRFSAGEDYVAFERVFSWLDANLRTSDFANTVAAQLGAWDPVNFVFDWPEELTAPRVVRQTVRVGERIEAPNAELGGAGSAYLAGHVNTNVGDLFNVNAYVDPLLAGFETANLGAIIPVNADPNKNVLEVWWFRTNRPTAGPNAGNAAHGFATLYWPSVLGRYELEWPSETPEIVLASKLGSGPLDSLRAQGAVYYQNDRAKPGYNPNEEHALMYNGQVFATRDDLNLTSPTNYSSPPFVLVEYPGDDGRPAMSVFRVLREKPEVGYVFDYVVTAGQFLEPPPPLGLLAKPVVGTGANAINYTYEPEGADLPVNWQEERDSVGPYRLYKRFTYRDRKEDFWVYRGAHAGIPLLEAGTYDPVLHRFVSVSNAIAVAHEPFNFTLHASRQEQWLSLSSSNLPGWLAIKGLTLQGTPAASDVGSRIVDLLVTDRYDGSSVLNILSLTVRLNGEVIAQAPLAILSTNSYTGTAIVFSNRPPHLAVSPTPSNSFTMRYYYRTEASFAWPGLEPPPAPGSIVPYLRPYNRADGNYEGDKASPNTKALQIVYRPVWPVRDPKNGAPLAIMPFGYTLAGENPFGLPQVRGMNTAQLLYQQSIAANVANPQASVFLHDSTRQKYCSLDEKDLKQLPGGIRTSYYQGKYYFPNLPPHLASRLFYDPNRGGNGSLVLTGEYKSEAMGESYLLLNLLRGQDLAAVKSLCPSSDSDYGKWVALVEGLVTKMETFYESPSSPGTFIPNPPLTRPVGLQDSATVDNDEIAVDSYALSAPGPGEGYVTLVEGGGRAFTDPGDPVAVHVFKVGGSLYPGEVKIITAANPLSEQITFQHTADLGGHSDQFEYEWKIAAPMDGTAPPSDAAMSHYTGLALGLDLPRQTLGGAGIRALSDNYVVLRYRSTNAPANPGLTNWSAWTAPRLAEGWIKRVLAGLNPFNQRIKDLFNNRVNTDVSVLTQAGHRWEGDIGLNLETINDYGLIEIYETVLRRGRMLSIEAGINYGPANDALLLAAGYLNDLYMMEGNEAWADAANPTIGIGTKNQTYGDIATALFAFKGQEPSLLEEELALLRGRDDFAQPGVELAPVYNRLIWNYTRGIDAGEVIYALNYNIQEDPDSSPDGNIDAVDAARMFPQGHGDAYGHYLTALKGYYSLLLNSFFDWVPRAEAVNVLGVPVQVDYLDERKFAAAAAAVARAGRQVFDLTWRKDYQPVRQSGWEHFSPTQVNEQRSVPTTQYWGMDHWASRTGQGAYLNWVVGNAILPETDANPAHVGIRKIDRTTVPELEELVTVATDLQTVMNNAEAGLSPLGLPEGSLAFDINPAVVVGTDNGTHFEQVYQRAKVALNNAVTSFDDAKDVTALMRAEQNSLVEFQAEVARQELAYNFALIEIYGSPYPDDLGPGKTYAQDYTGPDLIHFDYVDTAELDFPGLLEPTNAVTFKIDIQNFTAGYLAGARNRFDFIATALRNNPNYRPNSDYISFTLDAHGFFKKPDDWTGRRAAPGKVQEAASKVILARNAALRALTEDLHAKYRLDARLDLFTTHVQVNTQLLDWRETKVLVENAIKGALFLGDMTKLLYQTVSDSKDKITQATKEAIPASMVAGLANGGDTLAAARGALMASAVAAQAANSSLNFVKQFALGAFQFTKETYVSLNEVRVIEPLKQDVEYKNEVWELEQLLLDLQECLFTINQRLQELDDAERQYREVLARGDRLQLERETYRKRAAAVIQGYRTRDAAFRIFRNEKLERYKTLFDLAARYSMLAANAYDYETGLLNTSQGRKFINRIVNARALGVVRNGEPQYAGSDTGDPGLSSALAEMKADWDVLRGRLGFNNPDAYGTTVSLRTECLRILPTSDGDLSWKDVLSLAKKDNLLEDEDVRRYCMQVDSGDHLPLPGLELTFSTTISDGFNLFGRELAAGDHSFSPSSFATKIYAVGVALEGYRGMDDPSANSGNGSGSAPPAWLLDPLGLSATPYIYLIPVGVDCVRTPPLGDTHDIRVWSVEDVAIPMPFNIGASDLSDQSVWQSSDSLSETLFTIRKHQAFRPVSDASLFSRELYGPSGTLLRSQFTNNRLVGRSVWNSKWKLVIPGRTLLNDPNEGLERFIQTVRDIKLHFVTYSYAGN